MILGSISILLIISLSGMILMSVPSASYTQGSTVSSNLTGMTSNTSRVATYNSNVSIISDDQGLKAKLLAKDLEDTLRDGVSALELISNNTTPMTNPPDIALLKSTIKTLHGIPQNADEPKRKLVQDVLSKYKIFQYVGYQTPTGDLYFTEPYSHQIAIHTLNFAFREHYKGAVASRGPYLSNVITNVVTGKPNAIVAIPIYSQNGGGNKSLIGLLTASLNFTYFDQSLRSLNVTNNVQRIVLVDHNGTAIVGSSSSGNNKYVPKESFASLQSFKNAIAGKSGSIVESVNGTKMLVSYHPVKAVQRTWAVLLMKIL
ncbi:MAG: cache domain-containing protein [Candidatus Nitrosopolaris sp.]